MLELFGHGSLIVFTDAIRFALVLLGIAGGVGAIVFGRAAEEAAVR